MMTPMTFKNRNLPLLLSQMRETVISHFRPILNFFGLTEQQWRILRVLAENGPMEPKAICQTCQILSPSMAGILKRLEETRLIKRKIIPEDRRRFLVSLTPKSQKLIIEMAPLVEQQYELLEKAYGKQLIAQLYQVIDNFMLLKERPVKQVKLPKRKKG